MADAAPGYAGELVIEWPDTGAEFRRPAAGRSISLYEYRIGFGLTLLNDVTVLNLHASASDVITAELTRHRPTGNQDEPFAEDVSTWLVVGFRLRAPGAPR